MTNRCDEAWEWMQGGPGRVATENDQVHLDIGRHYFGARSEEASGIAGADGQESLSEQDVTQPRANTAPPTIDHVIHRDCLSAMVLHADLKAVLQVGADSRHVRDHVYVQRSQQRRRSKP